MHDLDLAADPFAQRCDVALVADGDELGTIAAYLFGEQFEIAAGGETGDGKLVTKCVDDVESRAADGAGAAENRDSFHADMILKLVKPLVISTQ